jgi:pimeloyl-ACP methyl ester carboxylesterase
VERPDTRVARNGELPLAYQVFGEGPTDLVYLPGFAGNVEGNWEVPGIASFQQRLASFTRVVVMDRRGTGCSERLAPGQAATLEEMIDDLDVVMRAASCRRTTLFAVQESAFIAMMAAATHPGRFERLILFGAAPCWRRNDEVPWAWTDAEWEDSFVNYRTWTSILDFYEGYVRTAAPSLIADPVATRLLAALGIMTNGPLAGEAESRRFSEIDVRGLLPIITVPTIVLHRTSDPVEPIESGRFLAEHIPDATLVELPGDDGLPWIGAAEPVLNEIEKGVKGRFVRNVPVLSGSWRRCCSPTSSGRRRGPPSWETPSGERWSNATTARSEGHSTTSEALKSTRPATASSRCSTARLGRSNAR